MSHDGRLRTRPGAVVRSVAFLTAGVLAVPLLTGCTSEDEAGRPLAGPDIAPAARDLVADGGTLRWAVDDVPETLNTFQSDADAATNRIAQAVLPSMYRLDPNGRPQRNPDYLESAKVVQTEPKQVVLYKLAQQAVWSDGREIGAADFAAQWRALSGKDTAYWTARNSGYDRIEKIERGANDLEVKVTFARPYADWQSLFSPLYPKDVMGTPDAFNDGARRTLKVTAGPFALKAVDHKNNQVSLVRNPRWWGQPAKLSEIDLLAVPLDKRAAALADGTIDLAEIDPSAAQRIDLAGRANGTGTPLQGSTPLPGPGGGRVAAKALPREAEGLGGLEVRKSLEPVYTQLALNGAEGPLADERVRRAVARALDRKALAEAVLKPLGLPAVPVGSHLALSGQAAYADNSGSLGGEDTAEAQALLADAGWVRGGPVKEQKKQQKGEKAAGAEGRGSDESEGGDDGTYIVGEDDNGGDSKSGHDKDPKDHTKKHEKAGTHLADGKQYAGQQPQQGGAPGAYAPKGTAAPAGAAAGLLAKDGKPLTLRFVLPSGPGSQALRTVADRISSMLLRVGISTRITKVSDESYFKDHIASGQFDLALYSWPASAFPATDARPIYAKPVPAADGSLDVEQNYTRVGTDQVDHLFDQAAATLDGDENLSLIRKADSRIWAAAGSIPLYQRPQLTAARKNVVNAGSFGFQTPLYQDMGFLKKGAKPSARASADD
ncbi:ABC transporter family substrate-binding protein [Streptomyces sp. NPDC001401]|uniref:ABC transporter family substrate-binding protein n=1 Tax=Streptomyces sp. NPDC001401 TaxID=3364570 RepID=UPI00367CBD87